MRIHFVWSDNSPSALGRFYCRIHLHHLRNSHLLIVFVATFVAAVNFDRKCLPHHNFRATAGTPSTVLAQTTSWAPTYSHSPLSSLARSSWWTARKEGTHSSDDYVAYDTLYFNTPNSVHLIVQINHIKNDNKTIKYIHVSQKENRRAWRVSRRWRSVRNAMHGTVQMLFTNFNGNRTNFMAEAHPDPSLHLPK